MHEGFHKIFTCKQEKVEVKRRMFHSLNFADKFWKIVRKKWHKLLKLMIQLNLEGINEST